LPVSPGFVLLPVFVAYAGVGLELVVGAAVEGRLDLLNSDKELDGNGIE